MRRKLSVVLALWSTACSSWQVQPGPLPRVAQQESAIRVQLKAGVDTMLYGASVVGDQLVGMSAPASTSNRVRVALDTADVRSVARMRFSAGRTIGLVAALALVLAAIAAASVGSTSYGQGDWGSVWSVSR